jgi:hypothetical protein
VSVFGTGSTRDVDLTGYIVFFNMYNEIRGASGFKDKDTYYRDGLRRYVLTRGEEYKKKSTDESVVASAFSSSRMHVFDVNEVCGVCGTKNSDRLPCRYTEDMVKDLGLGITVN